MKTKRHGLRVLAAGSMLAAFGIAGTAQAAGNLLINGDFESGGLAGWTVTDQVGGSGTWSADTVGTTTPFSGSTTSAAGGGAGTYAVSDQGGPGAHALTQLFTVPFGAAGSILVSFDMFINDHSGSGPIVDPAGLDYTVTANQHARVDILVAGASALSTLASDIVATLVAPTVDPANPSPFTSYLFDITPYVTAGTAYQIRFGEVDNQLFLNQGVDNVSISVQVPEAATVALLLIGIAGIGYRQRRQAAAL